MPTQSVALSLRISDTERDGISTFMRLMLPHGGVRTSEMTWRAWCVGGKHLEERKIY